MFAIDFNCDLGEGMSNDEAIMPFITSASIACGYHAGDQKTMAKTVDLCLKHRVVIGAHPSFPDRENFGRTEMDLSYATVYGLVTDQLTLLSRITNAKGATLSHVKPHGALYNMSAKDENMAMVIARAVRDFDKSLILYGLSGSHSIAEARKTGLKTFSEVFADRTYQDDGTLTPRDQPGALIKSVTKAKEQVLQFVKDKLIVSVSGKQIPAVADTVCIHGDGEQAVKFAKAIHKVLFKTNSVPKV